MAKKLHRFAFDFCREKEKKIIDKETAVAMLTCIMQNRWKLVNTFIEYLTKSTYRGINRDQRNNVFEFVRTFGDFENVQDYDPDGAWPMMIDEFRVCQSVSQFNGLLTVLKVVTFICTF